MTLMTLMLYLLLPLLLYLLLPLMLYLLLLLLLAPLYRTFVRGGGLSHARASGAIAGWFKF